MINSYASNVIFISLPTDNDSDDSVNGGSPKAPPNRQHRKEKKEFPVSLKIVHNMLRYNMCFNHDSHTSSSSVSLGFRIKMSSVV